MPDSNDEFEKSVRDYENWNPAVALTAPSGEKITFHVPNQESLWRVKTLLSKEPWTIRWLDGFRRGAVFLDVGANVGMYTIYASVVRGVKTFAFEPESQNFALLNKNIVANNLNGRVLATCAALSDHLELDRLYLSQFRIGSSCHSFGAEVGFDLKNRPSPYAQGCVSLTVDMLVDNGDIDIPNYIKVDVDGFEHKVLYGAENTLARPEVQEILIEINPGLKEHSELISWLAERGFVYDAVQAAQAARREGAFKGVGEIIFKRRLKGKVELEYVKTSKDLGLSQERLDAKSRHTTAMNHALRRMHDTPLQSDPFPHKIVDNVFPQEYFDEMRKQFPPVDSMISLGETGRVPQGAYAERLCVLLEPDGMARIPEPQRSFWMGLAQWLFHPHFINRVSEIFWTHSENRFACCRTHDNHVRVRGDGLLVSDRTNYAIGPHTDAPHRLITFLFYMPGDESLRALGTSIYRPKDPGFVCSSGTHYPFDQFERVSTAEFLPNRLFVFAKNERSFHGVEPIAQVGVDRRLLVYNVRLVDVESRATNEVAV